MAILETDTDKSEVSCRADRYYLLKNPDKTKPLHPDESFVRWLVEIGE